MNPFQDTYQNRIRSWRDLRTSVSNLPLDQVCVIIDQWWQKAPLINRHLHWNDMTNWPGPWDLLSENTYCKLTRALGICYTLLMCDIDNFQLVTVNDPQCEEHYLALVDNSKYTLNYWPDSVLNTPLEQFTILRTIPVDSIQNKLQ